ncbi:MAG TPA: alpha/beta hydrolase, partial [Vicinamibacterales bacterium]
MVHFTAAPMAPILTVSDVTLPNGVRLSYTQYGPKHGDAVFLLHGYSDSAFSFSRIMPLLPSSIRAIAPDLRGHGTSDRPASGYRIDDFAADVVQMMDALRVPRATIVGHSMGSFVAQSIAERAPERVSGLVLLGSAPVPANPGMFELQKEVNRLTDPVDLEFVRAFQYSTIAQPVPEAFMDAAVANSRKMPAAIWQLAMRGLIEFKPALPRPKRPVLVIGGDRDAVFSAAEQTALAAEYAGAELNIFDG